MNIVNRRHALELNATHVMSEWCSPALKPAIVQLNCDFSAQCCLTWYIWVHFETSCIHVAYVYINITKHNITKKYRMCYFAFDCLRFHGYGRSQACSGNECDQLNSDFFIPVYMCTYVQVQISRYTQRFLLCSVNVADSKKPWVIVIWNIFLPSFSAQSSFSPLCV